MDSWSIWVNASQRAVPVMLDAAVRGAVLLALAGIATAAMRRSSAAARHFVWLLALAGVLVLPMLSLALPGWRILPAMGGRAEAPPATRGMIVSPPQMNDLLAPPGALEASGRESPPSEPVAPREAANGPTVDSTTPPSPSAAVIMPVARAEKEAPKVVPAATPAAGAAAAGVHASAAPAVSQVPWQFWVAAAWLLGAAFVTAHVALGFVSLWLLRRGSRPLAEDGWRELLAELSNDLGLRQPVNLLCSPRRTMPMTWGMLRMHVLLPEQAATWPAEQRRAVLLHELGHAKRRDCLTQIVAHLACAGYWFNPLVWVAWRRMQVERERACDDLALAAGARASTYAQHLLQTASALPAPRFVGAAAAMARPSTLEERLRAILDPNRRRTGLSRRAGAGVVVLLLAALAPIAALRAQVTGTPATARSPATPAAASGNDASAIPPSETIESRLAQRRAEQLGAEGLGVGAPVAPARPAAPANPASTATCDLDATIYDVRIPLDKLGQIDADALAKAVTDTGTFEKALADLGTAVPLYRATQSVRLADDTISITTQTPYVTNSQITPEGKTINSVSYRTTGATFKIAGIAAGKDAMKLELTIDVAALSDSGTAISSNVTAPIFRAATLVHKGGVTARQPFVLISVDAASRDQAGNAVAYIARVKLGPAQEN